MDARSIGVVAVAAVLLLVVLAFRRASGDSAERARELVSSGALLLDVRTTGEFAGAHLDGALNIPVQDLEGRRDELPARDRPVVVYCASGARSARAKRMLEGWGFEEVVNLGPMSAWRE